MTGPTQHPASNSEGRKRRTRFEQLAAARLLSDDALTTAAQGCTEITCLYHGAVNEIRHERGIR